ncbi:RICIN domain-containing protein [Actinosynnema sp. NPDC050436]|uniref:RICIN domain-containing protein n=1 Tax=Actinosynnema sp. NPDC050436 TaxID=3155659 RepID=UPI00340E1A08
MAAAVLASASLVFPAIFTPGADVRAAGAEPTTRTAVERTEGKPGGPASSPVDAYAEDDFAELVTIRNVANNRCVESPSGQTSWLLQKICDKTESKQRWQRDGNASNFTLKNQGTGLCVSKVYTGLVAAPYDEALGWTLRNRVRDFAEWQNLGDGMCATVSSDSLSYILLTSCANGKLVQRWEMRVATTGR